MAKYDWALIKREYIQGYQDDQGQTICPTLDELCIRHGCSRSTIKKKSAKENWQQERNLYGTKRNQRILEKKEELMIADSANFDNKALDAANIGIDKGLSFLADKDLSIHDFNKVSQALSTFHRMGKLALGEPTEHTQTTGKVDVDLSIHDKIRKRADEYKRLVTPERSD